MSKKFKPELLREELKKFKMISEYSFYTGISEDDDVPDDLEPAGDAAGADATGGDTDPAAAADAVGAELGVGDADGADAPVDAAPAPAAPAPAPVAPAPAPADDEVDLDVTELVQGTEKATKAAQHAAGNSAQIMQKMGELENMVASMSSITAKIETLEKEIIKRNPTPVEKLEMRSLSSYPYSQKLTDYWAEKEGPYDVMNTEKEKEYVLTQDDVDNTYSESSIKSSFNSKPKNSNTYEEEDI